MSKRNNYRRSLTGWARFKVEFREFWTVPLDKWLRDRLAR